MLETFGEEHRLVARSNIFIGRKGRGSQKRRPYSFLRIDVQSGNPPRFVVRLFVIERFHKPWTNRELEPLVL